MDTGCGRDSGEPPQLCVSLTLVPHHRGSCEIDTRCHADPGASKIFASFNTYPWPRLTDPCSTAKADITEKIVVGMVLRMVFRGFDGGAGSMLIEVDILLNGLIRD